MARKRPSDEEKLRRLFANQKSFEYGGHTYKVLIAGKPVTNKSIKGPRGGEPKTDVYVKLQDEMGAIRELKISHKKDNADFLENKMKLERAQQIFGGADETRERLSELAMNMADKVANRDVYNPERNGRTEAGSYCLGYRLDIVNKPCGELSDVVPMSQEEKVETLAGGGLPDNKRNAMVNGEPITDSGVANLMLQHDITDDYTVQDAMRDIMPIEDYAKDMDVYFKLSAVNYRSAKGKAENRALLFRYDYSVGADGKLEATLRTGEPLEHTGREAADALKSVAAAAGIKLAPHQKSVHRKANMPPEGDSIVYVEGYTKANGVSVKSYWRHNGSRNR